MIIKELTVQEFNAFASNNVIGNYYQSSEYAMLKAEEKFDYEFIGLFDNNEIIAAALILYKKIGNYFYGYSPRGFLVDYSNLYILENFTALIKDYYKKRNFAFIKINPEIAISKLNKKTMNFEYNSNYSIINNLIRCDYKKLKNNMNFEALLPRVNAIINLENFDAMSLSKNTRNKIKKGIRKGLVLEKKDKDDIKTFYNFIKDNVNKNEFYYYNLYNLFNKTNSIDFYLVKVDYRQYLINSQDYYNSELLENSILNEKILKMNTPNVINSKMNSDKNLLCYKNDIAEASKKLNLNIDTYIAGAFVIKHENRVSIKFSAIDKSMKRFPGNYFLYFAILLNYKNNYKYADLDGIVADFSKDNVYHGLNRFKLGFNPDVYEYIGEFDLIINDNAYNYLQRNGLLAKEFNK